MSAHDYYQPHVYIDGRRLNEAADIDGLTPIADLKIKWGANDWWSNVEPAEARLTLIDPRGELLRLARGVDVMITADPDGRVLFRGTMEATTARYRHITNAHGTRYPVWEVEVIALDPLARLAADREHGPTYSDRNGQQNVLHWGRQSITERFFSLAQRTPVPILYSIPAWCISLDATWENDRSQPAPMVPYTTQQNTSVLTVLRQSCRIFDWTARPYFDPQANAIRFFGAPRLSASIQQTLGFTNDYEITIDHGQALTIDSAMLQPASGSIELALDPLDLITQVSMLKRRETLKPADAGAGYWGTHYEVEDVYGETSGVGGEGGATVELTYDLGGTSWTPTAASTATAAIQLNSKWGGFRALPPLRYEPGKTAASDPYRHDRLFRSSPTQWGTEEHACNALINTPLAWAATMPHFTVVGGELTYTSRRGWSADINPAPVWTRNNSGSTLGTLAAGADPFSIAPFATLADFDQTPTVADFQLL